METAKIEKEKKCNLLKMILFIFMAIQEKDSPGCLMKKRSISGIRKRNVSGKISEGKLDDNYNYHYLHCGDGTVIFIFPI